MGSQLHSAIGEDMIVIGSYFSNGTGFPAASAPAPHVAGLEPLLSSLGIPSFVLNLHELPSGGLLTEWFATAHEVLYSSFAQMVAPQRSYDAIFFIETITPSGFKKLR